MKVANVVLCMLSRSGNFMCSTVASDCNGLAFVFGLIYLVVLESQAAVCGSHGDHLCINVSNIRK